MNVMALTVPLTFSRYGSGKMLDSAPHVLLRACVACEMLSAKSLRICTVASCSALAAQYTSLSLPCCCSSMTMVEGRYDHHVASNYQIYHLYGRVGFVSASTTLELLSVRGHDLYDACRRVIQCGLLVIMIILVYLL